MTKAGQLKQRAAGWKMAHKPLDFSKVRRTGKPAVGRAAGKRPHKFALPLCIHLGERLPGPCGAALHRCGFDGTTVARVGGCKDAARTCRECPHRVEPPTSLVGHFNGSLALHQSRWFMASRRGWTDARIWLSGLNADLSVASMQELALLHPRCRNGQEDPRLFVHRGQLHCSFTGVEVDGSTVLTHQLVASLDDALEPANVWCPEYAGRAWPKEKNWVFFEGPQGELLSVYSVAPHVVLRHDGAAAVEVGRHDAGLSWDWGHLRGGASPVRVGGEWFHWFHGTDLRDPHRPEYTLGLYTFAPEPPFAPRRWCPLPLRQTTIENHEVKRVVFPGGAVLHDGYWRVSYGWGDQEVRIASFSAAEVESSLEAVPCPYPPS